MMRALLIAAALLSPASPRAGEDWWNKDWKFRRPITINNRLERPLGNSFPTRHFLARMVASLAVLERIRPSIMLVQVLLRHWMLDFKRDWFSMINATALPEMKKSFLRWLREPFHSNLWRQPRASRLEARRGLHQ